MSLFLVLYREGMSGLVLFAAIFAIIIFVVSVKFTETIILGIPSGEFTIFVLIQILMVAMTAFYAKMGFVARNLTIGFITCGIIITILTLCGIPVPGTIYFITTTAIAAIYLLFELMKSRVRGLLITILTAIASVSFLFSVNYVFTTVLQPHQQLRVKVALGIQRQPVKNSNRLRRVLRQRIPPRHTDKTQIRTRATHGLHILHHR